MQTNGNTIKEQTTREHKQQAGRNIKQKQQTWTTNTKQAQDNEANKEHKQS